MNSSINPIPLSLYIHLPWCVRKCPYCDFNSHALRQPLPEADYIRALIQDLEQELPHIWGRPILSIFFGGGTPSLFSPEGMDEILAALRARLNYSPAIEITMEANPGTVEQQRFAGFRQAGINRISLGIQSFANESLQILGRIHSGKEAKQAITALQQAGFDNFNLDLMHGLPEQSIEQGLLDLKQAIAFAPSHISWYQLTLEPNTQFYRHPPQLPDEDLIVELQQQGQALLKDHEYHHYEVSAYAKAERQCQHNLNYWQFGDYLGLGAGAHSKITQAATGMIIRKAKTRQPKDYLKQPRSVNEHQVPIKELAFEFMLNALRLQQPISWQLFENRTGLSPDTITPTLQILKQKNLIQYNNQHIQLTPLGHRFLNDVTQAFLNNEKSRGIRS